MEEFRAFTLIANKIVNKLTTDVVITPSNHAKINTNNLQMRTAIWDTRATNSCISKRVANELNLTPVGRTSISTANGLVEVNTYLVNIILPNRVSIQDILVTGADLGNDDVLIGMDIISLGDFSITNVHGRTIFSFRIPSIKSVDFVAEYNQQHKKI